MIYAINLILILIYGLILRPDCGNRKNRKAFCIIVCIQLSCICGLQYAVGTDYFSYLKIYNTVRLYEWGELYKSLYWSEPIFLLFTKTLGSIFKENFVAYFLFFSFAIYGFLLKAIYDRTESCLWSIYIYISFGLAYISMNQMRQMLALSIILYSIRFIEEKKWKHYILWVLVATGIHNSALIMLPCIFLRDIKLKSRKRTIMCLIVVGVLGYFLTPFFVENILSRTSYGWMVSYQAGQQENMLINLLYRGVLFVGCVMYIKPVLSRDKKYEVLYWLSIVGIVFQIMSVYATSIARITTYFYAVFIFLIPLVLVSIPKYRMKFLAKIVIGLGMLCYHLFYLIIRLDGLPYQSILSI